MATPLRFSVLMPAYNEARHLEANIRETVAVMEELGQPFEVIVVDDHSLDDTGEILQRAGSSWTSVRSVRLPQNQGKGYALRAGFEQCRGELVLFLDADLDLHPRQLGTLYRIMREQGADVVIGSKRHPQTVSNYPRRRRLASAAYYFLIKAMFGLPLRDTQTGIKLFRREVLERTFHLVRVRRYAFDLELLVLVHRAGYRIAEAPVVVDYKTKPGQFGPAMVLSIWWDTLRIWLRLLGGRLERGRAREAGRGDLASR